MTPMSPITINESRHENEIGSSAVAPEQPQVTSQVSNRKRKCGTGNGGGAKRGKRSNDELALRDLQIIEVATSEVLVTFKTITQVVDACQRLINRRTIAQIAEGGYGIDQCRGLTFKYVPVDDDVVPNVVQGRHYASMKEKINNIIDANPAPRPKGPNAIKTRGICAKENKDKVFASQRDAAKESSVHRVAISEMRSGIRQEHSGWTFQNFPTNVAQEEIEQHGVEQQDSGTAGHLDQDGSLVDGDVRQQDVDTTGDLVFDGSHDSHANGYVQQQDENASHATGDVPSEDISNVVQEEIGLQGVQYQDADTTGHLVQDGRLVDGDVRQQDQDTTGDLVYDGSHNNHANGDVQQQDENASHVNGDIFNDVVELDDNVIIEEDAAAMTTPNHSNTHKDADASMIVDDHIHTARKRSPLEQALLLSTAHPSVDESNTSTDATEPNDSCMLLVQDIANDDPMMITASKRKRLDTMKSNTEKRKKSRPRRNTSKEKENVPKQNHWGNITNSQDIILCDDSADDKSIEVQRRLKEHNDDHDAYLLKARENTNIQKRDSVAHGHTKHWSIVTGDNNIDHDSHPEPRRVLPITSATSGSIQNNTSDETQWRKEVRVQINPIKLYLFIALVQGM
jgi:hypothetical protein